ncbi:putative protein kinase RLK-Pelle-PERK-1 family [Lupinus albus]|uniref:non-specific serine/threonine protein kinase n=1 Tax=Lupinus albus TaxID=3870 RepID=A0A6A4P4V5_LUPAL|nr:putative protein kinase RLK-Pelle-PERK-1 family [Lupinus albus]
MSSPRNSSPDDATPDNATPDNATPDDADNSSSSSPSPPSDSSSSSPPPPSESSPPKSPPSPSNPPPSSSPPPSEPPPSSPPPSEPPPSSPPPSSPPPPKETPPSSPPPKEQSPPPKEQSPPPKEQSPPPDRNSSPPPTPPSSDKSPPPPSPSNIPTPPSSINGSPPPPASPGHSPPSPSNGSPSPPQNKSLPSNNNNTPSPPNSKGGGDNSSKAIVGAVIGAALIILIMVIVCVIYCRRKKKRKQMYYYGEQDGKGNHYYNNSGQPQGGYYGGQPHPDHVVGVQSGMAPPNSGWGAPPPQVNSAEMSSNFSAGQQPLPPPSPNLALGLKGTFSYEELAAATNGFNNQNLIGQGGFGYVHKGVLPNGKEVAVKSLKAGSGQGEREFQAEIDIISRVHHRHLVSLVGYCISGGQRMLVYEFIPNNTLEYHLHGKGVQTMDWPTRMRIAIGSAKGLAYLHEDCHPRIIHRDIKAANVLIDDSFEAKVADFGLAKLTSDNNTHVSTRVMGTFGYLAPEYASSGKLTEKSDVFSFGVMLLELISGKRPVDLTNTMEDSLVDWARPLLTRGLEEDPGNFVELVDPFLEGNYNAHEMARMAACAAGSIRHSAKKRLKMSQIVRTLEGDVSLDDLREGIIKTGTTNVHTSSGEIPYDTMQYNHDILQFRKAVFSSEVGTSSGSSSEMSRIQETPRKLT